MKRNIFSLVFAVIVVTVMFVIAIPTIIFNIGGKEYKLRGLDPKDFQFTFIWDNFTMQPATDLQGGKLYTLDVDLSSTKAEDRKAKLEEVKRIAYWRLYNAQVKGFQISMLEDDTQVKNKMLIKVPSSIDESLLSLLFVPGDFSLWTEDPSTDNSDAFTQYYKQIFGNRKQANVTNSDIESAVVVSDARCYVQGSSTQAAPRNYCVKIVFKQTSRAKVAAALTMVTNPSNSPVIGVDYQPVGILAGGQILNPSDLGRELLIYPFIDDKQLPNAILAAIISENPYDVSISMESGENLQPILGPNTLNYLKISLSLGYLVTLALIVYYFKKRGMIFIVTYSAFLIMSVAAFKIANFTLDFSFVNGYIAVMMLFAMLLISALYRIRTAFKGNLTADELKEIYEKLSIRVRNITLVVLFAAFIINSSNFRGTTGMENFIYSFTTGMIVAMLSVMIVGKAFMPYLLLNKKHE